MHKTCTKCKQEKPIENFRFRSIPRNLRESRCRECLGKYEREYWSKHPDRAVNHRHKKKNRNRTFHDFVSEYLLTHPCETCGETDIVVLDFDHLDPSTKKYAISTASWNGVSLDSIRQEMSKCRVLCSNCHRRHTAESRNTQRWQFSQRSLQALT